MHSSQQSQYIGKVPKARKSSHDLESGPSLPGGDSIERSTPWWRLSEETKQALATLGGIVAAVGAAIGIAYGVSRLAENAQSSRFEKLANDENLEELLRKGVILKMDLF